MYQTLLTRRYLSRRVMPMLAALGVALSVAMELITWNVMGGFLTTLIQSGRGLIGDVFVTWPQTGFAHYDELRDRLEADPRVEATSPVIESYGLINLPTGRVATVQIKGIDPESYHAVTGFHDLLWWKPIDKPLRRDDAGEDPRLNKDYEAALSQFERGGREMRMAEPDAGEGATRAAAVLGLEVMDKRFSRDPAGWIAVDGLFTPGETVTISTLPTDGEGRPVDVQARSFVVSNEAATGVYEVDANTVYVPLDELQDMTRMNAAERLVDTGTRGAIVFDENGEPVRVASTGETVVEPARVTHVLVRGVDGADLSELRDLLEQTYAALAADVEARGDVGLPNPAFVPVLTWEEKNATFIAAVRKETALVLFIFAIVSLTSVFLVLAIFWSMVSEKTKDIGTLRAIGASSAGVAGIWLAYGAAIGVVGGLAGLAIAWGVVTRINDIHDWLGESLGLYVWDPSVYYFSEIPSGFDPTKAWIVFGAAVLSTTLGALIPAWRAATMDPVKALRFE